MTITQSSVATLGRVAIGLIFAFSGIGKIAAPAATQAAIAAVGLPAPVLAYLVAIAVELGGGVLLALGYRTRAVAAILAAFTLATAVSFHADFADQNQTIHFLKNLMIAGGLAQLVAFGAGAFSLDALFARGRPAAGSLTAARVAIR